MAFTKPRMPTVIRLPFGFAIPIRYVSDAYLTKMLGGEKAFGAWYQDKIYINKNADLGRQIDTIGHELAHAIVDYKHYLNLNLCLPFWAELVESQEEKDD